MTSFTVLFRLLVSALVVWSLVACTVAIPESLSQPQACTDGNTVLNLGFYAFFEPVSYSANSDPAVSDFNTHQGYEADLLSALEAMENTGLSFARSGIAAWDQIWLQSAQPQFDMVGGGITILDSRTRDAGGDKVVTFTSGHITFRQSLLVRTEDANRLASHDLLTSDVRVGVLAGTTGEARLLQLTGLADDEGVLLADTRIDTPEGAVVSDGSVAYAITAAGASPVLEGRTHVYPPGDNMPQVIYLGDELGDVEIIEALRMGQIDAVARGEVGNREAVHALGAGFTVTAFDSQVEYGGFTLPAEDTNLIACINERIDWLTDERTIGYAEWLADPGIFQQRADHWNAARTE
ncbi:MAG: transporter substrate-binding domain-containing protein [Caldilineaceae bacterium]|nr:transporter substrate-binding domain-containing protein [Caldilineaceae bacterium]MXZ24189.1 amino acid ABC transporter substrate-binding protein [Caldilineaceae bacterium SB0665_bin_21]